MVLGNYVIKDMGGNIQDAFGGIGPIITNGNRRFWNFIFDYRNDG
jgi:hypothetical protein